MMLYSFALLIPILCFIQTLNFYQDVAKKQSLATEYNTTFN